MLLISIYAKIRRRRVMIRVLRRARHMIDAIRAKAARRDEAQVMPLKAGGGARWQWLAQ